MEEREHGHVEGGGEMKRAGVGREEKIDTGDEGGEAGERLRWHDEHGAVGEAGELRGEVAFFGADENEGAVRQGGEGGDEAFPGVFGPPFLVMPADKYAEGERCGGRGVGQGGEPGGGVGAAGGGHVEVGALGGGDAEAGGEEWAGGVGGKLGWAVEGDSEKAVGATARADSVTGATGPGVKAAGEGPEGAVEGEVVAGGA